MGKRGEGGDDEQALWEKVAASTAPLKSGRKPPLKAPKPPAPLSEAKPQRTAASAKPSPAPVPKPRHVPRAAPLDRQTSRQLDKGA